MSNVSDYDHWNEEAPAMWAAEQSPYDDMWDDSTMDDYYSDLED